MEITKNEIELVDELRRNLSDLCLDKHHLDTKNLVRFLRARNHNIPNAEDMFRRQIEWREENDIDNIITDYQYPKEYRTQYWPWYISGFDNADSPILVLPIGLWDPSKVGNDYNDFVKYTYHSFESVWRVMQMRGQGEKTHKQLSAIVDLKGLAFRTVTTIDAMQGVLNAVKVFESCYPEVLRVGVLINAPYVFEMAWRLIKPFVSEYTYSKLRFLGSDVNAMRSELLQYMDADQFPSKYGGTLPDSYEVKIINGCAQIKGSSHTNSNDYICDNLMRA